MNGYLLRSIGYTSNAFISVSGVWCEGSVRIMVLILAEPFEHGIRLTWRHNRSHCSRRQ